MQIGVFTSEPKKFSPLFVSCGCFIRCQEKFLLLQKASSSRVGKLWGIPSGRMEKEENSLDAIVREIHEETGIKAQRNLLQYIGKFYVLQPESFEFIYHIFHYEIDEKKPVTLSEEHMDFKWLSEKEILTLPLIPGQKDTLYHLTKMQK